ncbi:MAG: DMT family transporter [Candidatus Zixiibacteriota bacterium]
MQSVAFRADAYHLVRCMNMSGPNRPVTPLLMLSFGATCISFAAIFVKLLGMERMWPTAIGFWRTLFGAAILFGWTSLRGNRLAVPGPVILWSLAAGFLFFLDLFFWHRSILYSGAGMATILANTQVFGTAVLSYLVLRERLSLKFFVAAVCAIIGVVLLIGIGSNIELTTPYLRGVLFGLLTGVVYAHYIIVLKIAGHKDDRLSFLTLMAWTSLFSAFFLGVAGLIESDPLLPPDWFSVGILFVLGLVAQAMGWWLIAGSLPRINASRSGLALLLQPVLATVWGVIFFGEYLTLIQILGAVITLLAIYVGSVRVRKGLT